MKKPPTSKPPRPPLRAVPTPAPAPAASAPPEPAKESAIDSRLAIPLDKDGRVLVDNMRVGTRDKLKELFTNAELAKELGISPDAAPGTSDMALPPELMLPLVHGLSIIGVMVVGKLTNAPREIVERVVPFSRDEVEAVAPALANVLNKYAGSALVKYKEEAALLGIVIALGIRKTSLVRDEVERRKPMSIVTPFAGATDAPPAEGPAS